MKYIDADKLKTELNKRIELLENGDAHSEVMKRVEGIIKGYKATLTFIDSLEQEQPEVDLEEEFIDFLEKENAYVDDNNKISYYNGSPFDHTYDIYPIARHFYNLGINAGKV